MPKVEHRKATQHLFERTPDAHRWMIWCFVVLLTAYLSTVPQTLTDADAGEFLVIAKTGGVAHPPGYPLFTLVGQALALGDRWLPLVSLIAGFSSLCAAAAGALLVRALAPLLDVRATAFAVLLAFLTPEVWRQANAAEPFALNLLLASIVLTASIHLLTASLDSTMRALVPTTAFLGFAFGLGFANHHTLALLAPLPIACIVRWRHHRAIVARALGLAFLAFALGASPLLALLLANKSAPLVYGDWDTSRLLRHVLRFDYGTLQLSAVHHAYGENLWHFARGFPKHTAFLGPILLLIGFTRAWRALPWIALLATTLCAGPVFLALMNIPPLEEPVIVARFFALPMMLCVPWFAAAITGIVAALSKNSARIFVLGISVLLLGHALVSRDVSNRSEERVYDMHVRQMLAIAGRPTAQVLVSASDLEDYGLAYGQHVLGLAPRAPVVMLGPFHEPWYRARLATQLGLSTTISATGFVSLLESLNTSVPLFVVDAPEFPRPALFARARPLGGLLVVIPDGATMPTWLELYAANIDVLDELSVIPSPHRRTPLSGWELRLLQQHRDRWRDVCVGLRETHHLVEATACDRRGNTYNAVTQRLGTTQW